MATTNVLFLPGGFGYSSAKPNMQLLRIPVAVFNVIMSFSFPASLLAPFFLMTPLLNKKWIMSAFPIAPVVFVAVS